MFDHVHIPARRLLPGLVAAMALLAMAGTASAATPPGHYTISANGGAVFPLQTSGNLVSGPSDDNVYYLSTTGTGLQKLPFTINCYNHGYKKIGIRHERQHPVRRRSRERPPEPPHTRTTVWRLRRSRRPWPCRSGMTCTSTRPTRARGSSGRSSSRPRARRRIAPSRSTGRGTASTSRASEVLARAVFTEGSQTLTGQAYGATPVADLRRSAPSSPAGRPTRMVLQQRIGHHRHQRHEAHVPPCRTDLR